MGVPRACAGPGCTQTRRPGQLMCSGCWFKVPKKIRDRIYDTHRAGAAFQSPEWLQAVDDAIAALTFLEG